MNSIKEEIAKKGADYLIKLFLEREIKHLETITKRSKYAIEKILECRELKTKNKDLEYQLMKLDEENKLLKKIK
ncbi:hypothetical protein [Enterococcus sp. AZ103]|uniref:hypothetical protein n=1 Tax=Enterococcus sp. AZ103 TaxID=2774628 RepID=UPI003F236268